MTAELGQLMVSLQADRSDAVPLAQARLPGTGNAYFFFDEATDVNAAEYWLNQTPLTTFPSKRAYYAPWDFVLPTDWGNASAPAEPFDLATLPQGRSLMTIRAADGSDVDVDTVEFFVDDNLTPDAPPDDPEPASGALDYPTGILTLRGGDPLDGAVVPIASTGQTVWYQFTGDDATAAWYWRDKPNKTGPPSSYGHVSANLEVGSWLYPSGQHTVEAIVIGEYGAVELSATFTVVVANGPPARDDQTGNQAEGSTVEYSIGTELQHPDPDGDAVTIVSIDTGPSNGLARLLSPTTLEYEHDGSETSTDEITYTITDDAGNQAPARLLLSITEVNDPPVVVSTSASVVATAPIDVTVSASDVDGSVTSMSTDGLPAGLSETFDANTEQLIISGTADASVRGSTQTVIVTAVDDDGAARTGNLSLVFDPIALSPNVGRVQITEVLFRESEKWDPLDPDDNTYLMDEYIEWTMVDTINMTGYRLTDTNPHLGVTDLERDPATPTSPLDAGTIDEVWGNSGSFAAGTIITTAIRWPHFDTFRDYDGVDKSTIPFDSWFYQPNGGPFYGFFPPDNSKWQAFNDHGDELWLFDPDGLLVDYVAWDDGTGLAHVDRPPAALGVWDASAEATLAAVAAGQSISRAASTPDGTFSSQCWEPTASGSATCPGAVLTRDLDDGVASRPASLARVSSQGRPN